MQVITLGPLSMDASLLFSLLALMVMFFVVGYLEKKQKIKVETRLWLLVLLAAIVGRGVFVARFWPHYHNDWLAILNVRDGGFSWQAALGFGAVTILIWILKKPVVRRILLSGVAAGVVVWLVSFSVFTLLKSEPVMQMPVVELRTLDQEPVGLTQFKGKPIVLNLWASWCPPCRREMPVLQHAQKTNTDVHFVFANQAESAELVKDYLDTEGLELDNVLLDLQTQVAHLVQSRGLPTTLFIDAQGNIQTYRIGELSNASLSSHLKDLKKK